MKEGDEVIARFHGWEHKPTLKGKGKGLWYFPECGKAAFNGDGFQYHTSFDWLMPVFSKFSSLDLAGLVHVNHSDHSDRCASIAEKILEVDITGAHEALVDGIEWYNNQKSPILYKRERITL